MKKTSSNAYTLIEVIIVIAILVMVLTVIFNIFFVSRDTFTTGFNKSIIQQDARISASIIIDELKLAKEVSVSPISGDDYYSINLQPNAETLYNSLLVQKFNAAGNLLSQRITGSYIQSIQFQTTSTDNSLVQFIVIANTGEDDIQINSSVLLNNTTADLTSSSSTVYYSKY